MMQTAFLTRQNLIRTLVTVVILIAAIIAGRHLWRYYEMEPWTRDGRVRADIIQIAPDVSGLVVSVDIRNDQIIHKGQVLFRVDPARFELALQQADALVAAQRIALAQASRESARNARLGSLVSGEVAEQGVSHTRQLQAALDQARVARAVAALNLQRATVVSPVDGLLSDMTLFAGGYVTAGRPVLALIDRNSYRVEGYLEETKLRRVHIGDRARVRLMGDDRVLEGRVTSIATGIEDRERGPDVNLLPNINPTYSWVRLAQRVPVRVHLDKVPPGVNLILGRTATVEIIDGKHPQEGRK